MKTSIKDFYIRYKETMWGKVDGYDNYLVFGGDDDLAIKLMATWL